VAMRNTTTSTSRAMRCVDKVVAFQVGSDR
jgi:hypothetical protein